MRSPLFQLLLLSLIPAIAAGQSYIPNTFGLVLPISEQYLKSEFSIRYNIRAMQPNMQERWRETYLLKSGDYYENIRLEGELIEELKGLKLVRLTLIGTSTIIAGKTGIGGVRMVCDGMIRDAPAQDFLLGIDEQQQIYYLSGNIFLDPIDHLLADPTDMATLAKIRIYYLSDDALVPMKAREGHYRYETKSTALNRNIVIDLQDQNRFKIYPKGDENHPIAVVGGWTRN